MGYNVVLVKENGKLTRASLAKGIFVSEDGDTVQSTVILNDDRKAAERLLEYGRDGAHVPERDRREAERILA